MAQRKPTKPRQEVAAAPEQDELGVDEPEAAVAELEPAAEAEPEAVELEAPTEPEAGPSMEQLYARATELKIRNRRKMNRTELIEAIQTAELEGSVPEIDEPGGPPEEAEAEAPREATQEQARKVFAATTEQLENAAADPSFPDYLKKLVVQELGRRVTALQQKNSLSARMGPLERYVVTKGGRYVTRDGFPTHLPEGALVTPLTHDLKDVAKQGIEFKPARLVAVGLDEMGRQISEVR